MGGPWVVVPRGTKDRQSAHPLDVLQPHSMPFCHMGLQLSCCCPCFQTCTLLSSPPRYGADVDVNHHLPSRAPGLSLRPLTTLVVCPLYISAAYHNLQCFRLLLQAGANPDFNCCGPINIQGFSRGSPVCVMDAVLRHGCEAAFVHLLIDFGANLNLVKVEALGVESTGRVKVNPEALQVFKEARGKWL